MDGVVAPVLHNKDPVTPDVVKTEFSQLLTRSTAGAGGIILGAAIPLPAALLHPPTDCVTV